MIKSNDNTAKEVEANKARTAQDKAVAHDKAALERNKSLPSTPVRDGRPAVPGETPVRPKAPVVPVDPWENQTEASKHRTLGDNRPGAVPVNSSKEPVNAEKRPEECPPCPETDASVENTDKFKTPGIPVTPANPNRFTSKR